MGREDSGFSLLMGVGQQLLKASVLPEACDIRLSAQLEEKRSGSSREDRQRLLALSERFVADGGLPEHAGVVRSHGERLRQLLFGSSFVSEPRR